MNRSFGRDGSNRKADESDASISDRSGIGATSQAGIHSEGAGYSHRLYAESLREFGMPRSLPGCGGWVLERNIPGTPLSDAMGTYPIFSCRDWSKLGRDLEDIGDSLVSLVLVADPFGELTGGDLARCFPDKMIPFKEHFVVDLSRPRESFVSRHHQRSARLGLRAVDVERHEASVKLSADWVKLYGNLIRRHDITNFSAFSEQSLSAQLVVPGTVVFCALHDGAIIGMTLWYVQGEIGSYHLGAYDQTGYSLHASFALFWSAMDAFAAKGVKWLDLGGGAGLRASGSTGLARFKQGWSTGIRTAFLCGRVFDRQAYTVLTDARARNQTEYFPAYREGEFT